MMTSTRPFLGLGLLLSAAACSRRPVQHTEYVVQTNCAGGGGQYNCSAKNPTTQRFGPFDLGFEFANERGAPIGTATVTNPEGLEPQGDWEFTLSGPPTARAVRLTRVTPR